MLSIQALASLQIPPLAAPETSDAPEEPLAARARAGWMAAAEDAPGSGLAPGMGGALETGAGSLPPSVPMSDAKSVSTTAGKRAVAGSSRSWPVISARDRAPPGESAVAT